MNNERNIADETAEVSSFRARREVNHGKKLSGGLPDVVWGWGSPAGKVRASRRALLIIEGAMLRPLQAVLEIGCGTGVFTEKFAASGANVTALDISPDLLEIARARNLLHNNVSFVLSDFEGFRSADRFDSVIGSSVLHHLDISLAISNIFKMLKPGGLLCFAEPNMLNPQVFVERKFRAFFSNVSNDETAFTRWGVAGLLKSVGYEDVVVKPFDWLHPAVPERLIGIVEAVGRVFEKTPLVREFAGSLIIMAKKPFSSAI